MHNFLAPFDSLKALRLESGYDDGMSRSVTPRLWPSHVPFRYVDGGGDYFYPVIDWKAVVEALDPEIVVAIETAVAHSEDVDVEAVEAAQAAAAALEASISEAWEERRCQLAGVDLPAEAPVEEPPPFCALA